VPKNSYWVALILKFGFFGFLLFSFVKPASAEMKQFWTTDTSTQEGLAFSNTFEKDLQNKTSNLISVEERMIQDVCFRGNRPKKSVIEIYKPPGLISYLSPEVFVGAYKLSDAITDKGLFGILKKNEVEVVIFHCRGDSGEIYAGYNGQTFSSNATAYWAELLHRTQKVK
jgi:hypothetical protein